VNFEREMIALAPELRAFARVLMRDRADADDLVQDALMRMWAARDRFAPGTNLRAWAFTILRNRFYNVVAKQRATVCIDDVAAERLSTPPQQEQHAQRRDIQRALQGLEPELREVLALAVGSEMDYATIASVVGVPVGTVKSRVFRARRRFAELLADPVSPPAGSAGGRLRRDRTGVPDHPSTA
jgi:RNA polymerase sigma-70 factor, ECF subfamily